MAQLDQISEAIGRLQSQYDQRAGLLDQLARKIDCLDKKVDRLLHLPADVKELQEIAENYKALRNRGLGVLAVMGTAGGAFGSGIISWIKGHLNG